MAGKNVTPFSLSVHPLTPERWDDFETLFGPRGACGGCWCMYWKLTSKEFERQKGEANRLAMKSVVESGVVPGLMAYIADDPVAWCAVEPRRAYSRLARSRILKPVDDQPVWSVSCFFTAKPERRNNRSLQLLLAACDWVRANGGKIVEGYPVEPKKESMPDAFVYHGLASTFIKAGFTECIRRSETRPIMRKVLK